MHRSRPGGSLASLGDGEPAASTRLGTLLLVAVMASAVGYRLWLALVADFPINDGALFYEFVRALARSFPALPEYVRYNGIDVPFAYPPLSFWAGAALTRLGADPLVLVRLAPIAMNAVYVLLFAALLIRNGQSRLFTALAVLFLIATLRAFEWLVMGGGLSRGLGSLFLLLTLLATGLPRARREESPSLDRTRIAIAGLCIGGAILSHLEWGVLSTGAFVAGRALSARTLPRFATDLLIAGATALLCVAPWIAIVVNAHGIGPFLAAGGTSDWSLAKSAVEIVGVLFVNRANLFFLLGAIVLIARREWFWPIFILLCLFLTPRHSGTPLVLGTAFISAHGVLACWALLRRTRLSDAAAASIAALLLGLTLGWQIYGDQAAARPFRPLPAVTRDAMHWVRTHHLGARVAVVTAHPWFYDASAEWFPTLAGATSLATVQGREWLPNGEFARWVSMDRALKNAAGCAEVLAALRAFGAADLIWAEARQECFEGSAYRLVYRRGNVAILRPVAPA